MFKRFISLSILALVIFLSSCQSTTNSPNKLDSLSKSVTNECIVKLEPGTSDEVIYSTSQLDLSQITSQIVDAVLWNYHLAPKQNNSYDCLLTITQIIRDNGVYRLSHRTSLWVHLSLVYGDETLDQSVQLDVMHAYQQMFNGQSAGNPDPWGSNGSYYWP